jgi:membrane protease YdiL (CAAX protease family)
MFTTSDGRLQPVWAFVLSSLLAVAAFLVAGYFAEVLAGEHYLVFEALFRTLLATLLVLVFLWLLTVADHVESGRVAVLGFPLQRELVRQFATGFAIGVVLTVVAVAPLLVWGNATVRLRLNWYNSARLGAVLLALLSGALAEELMFRGYPFQHLEQGIGAWGAIAVFSVMFGLVHLSNPGATVWGLANTVLIGIVLSIAYLRTRALWLPWGIHLGWNASLGVLFGLPVSGLRIFNVMVRTNVSGPQWLTGGSYGVEASVAGAVAMLLGMAVVSKLPLARFVPSVTLSAESGYRNGFSDIQP